MDIKNFIKHLDNDIDRFQYACYEFNRNNSPDIAVEDWRRVFGKNTDMFEQMYIEKHTI